MIIGLALDYVGLNALKMLFWAAVVNGLLAPPLILIVLLLTDDRKVMGDHVNSLAERILGWTTFAIMTAAGASLLFS